MAASGGDPDAFMQTIWESFIALTGKPERFLETHVDVSKKFKTSTKSLYDFTKVMENISPVASALPELIVDSFDDEQIWQEIELQNEPTVQDLLVNVSQIAAGKSITFDERTLPSSLKPKTAKKTKLKEMELEDKVDNNKGNICDVNEKFDEEMDGDGGFPEGSDESEEEKELKELLERASSQPIGDNESSEDDLNFDFGADFQQKFKRNKHKDKDDDTYDSSEGEEEQSSTTKKIKKVGDHNARKTAVDDKFFRLADMEVFLEKEDARWEKEQRVEKQGQQEEESSDEEDEDVDMFAEEEDEGGEDIHYTDFFDPPEQEEATAGKKAMVMEKETQDRSDSTDESEEEEPEKSGPRDLFAASDSEGEEIGDILGGSKKEVKSTYELRQERLKAKISEIEEAALGEKPWQLMGEASAKSRPENSLLQEDLDFEHTTKSAPEITEETTKSLEDIIKQRIKDKVWDDVERKVKPVEEAYEYKKRVVLDQEKSKQSLSQIYEEEYLKQMQKDETEKTDPQHDNITKMMTSLFLKLDALSNFQYTPKPASADVKIVSNLPSITVEEVAPVTASTSDLLAPEEIKEKNKQEVKGTTEKDATDRARERREKKSRQKKKAKKKKVPTATLR